MLIRDCFEASIRFAAAVLLADFLRKGPSAERRQAILEDMIHPTLGTWVKRIKEQGEHLRATGGPGAAMAELFLSAGPDGRPLHLSCCDEFVMFRNDVLAHGTVRPDDGRDHDDLRRWLPRLERLLEGIAGLASTWRLCRAVDAGRCEIWMGVDPGSGAEDGAFDTWRIGHFVWRGPADQPALDLHPFLCYLADEGRGRACFHDGLDFPNRCLAVRLVDFGKGVRERSTEPAAAWENIFGRGEVREACDLHRRRVEVLEGPTFPTPPGPNLVGRRFVLDQIDRFLRGNDRSLLVISGQPGRGKTALMIHLAEACKRPGDFSPLLLPPRGRPDRPGPVRPQPLRAAGRDSRAPRPASAGLALPGLDVRRFQGLAGRGLQTPLGRSPSNHPDRRLGRGGADRRRPNRPAAHPGVPAARGLRHRDDAAGRGRQESGGAAGRLMR